MHPIFNALLACVFLNPSVFAQVFTAAEVPTSNGLASVECLVVDSDGNMDDLRALAIIAPHRRIATIIATAGILPEDAGAQTLARFFRQHSANRSTAVVQGFAAAIRATKLPKPGWFDLARADALRLKEAMPMNAPATEEVLVARDPSTLARQVKTSTRDCASIGLLVLGPWSSFLHYHHQIAERTRFVVVQGRSKNDPDDPGHDRVNCSHDLDACTTALTLPVMRQAPVYWVDIPKPTTPQTHYPIVESMVTGLGTTEPLASALKRLMQKDSA